MWLLYLSQIEHEKRRITQIQTFVMHTLGAQFMNNIQMVLLNVKLELYFITQYVRFFEINESSLSDARCLIQDVVSPHCDDKRMARRYTRRSLSNYFDMTSYHWNVRQNTITWRWWMNRKNNVTLYTKCSLSQSVVHILIQPLLFV